MGSEQYPATVSRDAMAEHYAYLAEQHNKPKAPVEQNGLVDDFLRSVGHSAIQTPINAVVQLADKGLGTNLLPKVQIGVLEAPTAAEYGTSNYWAQQSGNAVGMLLPFMAAGKGVKAITRAGMSEVQLAERLSQRTVLGLSMKEAVLTGAVHDTLLRPVDEHNTQPFLVAKGLNGVNGALTMGVMHGIATRFAPAVGAETSRFASLIKNPYMGGLASGVGAGGVSAHTHSYLGNLKFDSLSSFGSSASTEAKFATWKETKESMVTMGVVGLGFGTYHGVKGKFESPRKNFEWQKPGNDVATANGERVNVQGKDFKVVGGERALTRALETLDKTGEVSLAVREHIGAGKGFKRFLRMQEYGPEQNLLVKHNKTGQPIAPDAGKLADLIATCYLDPTMAGKSVLGARSLSEAGPIFMRSGKNRLNFSPTEQETRKGETQPRKLGAGEGYDPTKIEIRESESWTKDEIRRLYENEWTPEMVAKLKTVTEYLKGTDAHNFRDALKGTKLADMRVARYLSQGNDAFVVELAPQKGLPDGGALKLANNYEGGWNDSWGKRPFDAEILMGGKHWEVTDSSGRDVLAYVQELVTPDFDEALWPRFKAKLDKAGLQVRDPGQEGGFQYGQSLRTGKLVLTDYESTDKNPTLERLMAGNNTDRLEELEREEIADELKGPQYDSVEDVDVLRGKSEAYPPDSWQKLVFDELQMGSSAQDASLSYIAWKAKQLPNPADAWVPAVQKEALAKTRALAKEAKSRGLLH